MCTHRKCVVLCVVVEWLYYSRIEKNGKKNMECRGCSSAVDGLLLHFCKKEKGMNVRKEQNSIGMCLTVRAFTARDSNPPTPIPPFHAMGMGWLPRRVVDILVHYKNINLNFLYKFLSNPVDKAPQASIDLQKSPITTDREKFKCRKLASACLLPSC
jgi:hypothetical protein